MATETMSSDKGKALELAIASIEKQFGKGSIMKLGGDKSLYENVPVYSTGSLSLDIALGIGGELIPREAIRRRQPDRIAELARRFTNSVSSARAQ